METVTSPIADSHPTPLVEGSPAIPAPDWYALFPQKENSEEPIYEVMKRNVAAHRVAQKPAPAQGITEQGAVQAGEYTAPRLPTRPRLWGKPLKSPRFRGFAQ